MQPININTVNFSLELTRVRDFVTNEAIETEVTFWGTRIVKIQPVNLQPVTMGISAFPIGCIAKQLEYIRLPTPLFHPL